MSYETRELQAKAALNALSLNPSGDLVVLAGREVLKIVSVDTKKIKEVVNLRAGSRLNLNLSSNEVKWCPSYAKHLIATAATNGSIVLWNLNKPVGQRQDRIISEHSRAVNRLCFHPTDAIILLSASQDGTMRMWDLRTKNTAQYVFEGKSEAVRDVQFAPGNAYAFAAAFENGTFQKWDIRFPKLYEKKWNAHNALVLSLDWHQDGRYLATGGRDKQIKVWDTVSESRKPLVTIHNVSSVSKVAWQPTVYGNPIRIACSSLLSDNRIHVFDIERPSIPSYSFECHSNVVTGFQWKNSETIFSVSKDQKFAISSFPTTTESEGSGYRITDYISSSSISFSPWDDIAVSSRILSERSQTPVEMLTHERTYSREKGIKPNILNEESLLRGSTVTLMTNNQFNLDSSSMTWFSSEKPLGAFSRLDPGSSEDLEKSYPVSSYFSLRGSRKPNISSSLTAQASYSRRKEWTLNMFTPDSLQFNAISHLTEDDSSQRFCYYAEELQFFDVRSCKGPKNVTKSDICSNNAIIAERIGDYNIGKFWRLCSIFLKEETILKAKEWDFSTSLKCLFESLIVEGDVQMLVCLDMIFGDVMDYPSLQVQEWYAKYIEMLHQRQFFTAATEIISSCRLESIQRFNQDSTSMHTSCNRCFKPLLPREGGGFWVCEKCQKFIEPCVICKLPVRSVFLWCRTCGHGGHIEHMKEWFKEFDECPSGCGHKCHQI